MRPIAPIALICPSIALLTVAAGAKGQFVDATIDAPSLDRWMYPFNAEPGSKLEIQTFGASLIPGFDDLDGQMIIGFDTSDVVPAGLGATAYRIGTVIVTTTNSNGNAFEYDPSYDSYTTHLDPGDPDFTPDGDPGWPISLYGVGYRAGFDLLSFEEDSTFGDIPPDFDTEGVRVAYAALFDDEGAFDVSRHVKESFEAPPLATGVVDGLAPGSFVPLDSTFSFDVDICTPGVRDYVKASLDAGRINLAVTSLTPAAQQDPSGLPRWYTKENPLALPPFNHTATLTLVLIAGDYADFNGDGVKNILDFVGFQEAFVSGSPLADANEDCVLNVLDFVAFQVAFTGG